MQSTHTKARHLLQTVIEHFSPAVPLNDESFTEVVTGRIEEMGTRKPQNVTVFGKVISGPIGKEKEAPTTALKQILQKADSQRGRSPRDQANYNMSTGKKRISSAEAPGFGDFGSSEPPNSGEVYNSPKSKLPSFTPQPPVDHDETIDVSLLPVSRSH